FWQPSKTTCGDGSFGDFLTPRLNSPLQFSSCDPWRFFCQWNHPPHGAWGQCTDTSSSRLILNISCRLNFLIISMIVEMSIFNSLEIFLGPFLDLCSSTTFYRTSSLCSWVFPIVDRKSTRLNSS